MILRGFVYQLFFRRFQMKKFTAILVAIVLALFVVSCGGGSNKEKDDTDTTPDGDVVDTDTNTDTEPSGDTDVDTEPDPDTEPNPDTEPDPDTEPEGCQLDASILNWESEPYFAFKGIGKINDPNTSDPDWTNMVTVALKGIDGKDLDYANQYSFYLTTQLQGQDAEGNLVPIDSVAVEALGDPNMSTGRFTTIAFAAVPIDYIETLKENEEILNGVFPSAPITQIIDILYTSDTKFVRQCMVAVNKYGANEVFGQEMPLGQFQVCYDKNVDFSIGETFKMAMVAELAVGQEIVDMYTDVDSVDDLCNCFDLSTEEGDEVDCATIPEFAGGDDPTEPDPTNPTEPDPTEQLTCDAEAHKELNEAGDACVCMTGYTENAETHACEADAPALTCNAEEHKELNEAGDACVCMTGYTENAETHACEAE